MYITRKSTSLENGLNTKLFTTIFGVFLVAVGFVLAGSPDADILSLDLRTTLGVLLVGFGIIFMVLRELTGVNKYVFVGIGVCISLFGLLAYLSQQA